ncbi:50S ribosomal protein L24 [Candidatus Pacearchaeota archaeon]|nr:50S ribosomal protein L24 [Candidatus Pacearchaeota archaeon]
MKNEFSKHWVGSKRPGKQRKYLAKAPLHIRKKLLNVSLSKELRKKYGRRAITVRKGDKVKILVGKFKKKEGKVTEVNYGRLKIYVEGIQIKKLDGSMTNVPMRSSNIQIIELNLDDKMRVESLNKKQTEVQSEKKNEEKVKVQKPTKTSENKLKSNKK